MPSLLLCVQACAQVGCKKMVYTSTAGVIFNGNDLKGVDETHPYITKHIDPYTDTKQEAEKVCEVSLFLCE
jgi:sterol-4alpha-carboxylate 3-dehydrogenase (decarboxylating)